MNATADQADQEGGSDREEKAFSHKSLNPNRANFVSNTRLMLPGCKVWHSGGWSRPKPMIRALAATRLNCVDSVALIP